MGRGVLSWWQAQAALRLPESAWICRGEKDERPHTFITAYWEVSVVPRLIDPFWGCARVPRKPVDGPVARLVLANAQILPRAP